MSSAVVDAPPYGCCRIALRQSKPWQIMALRLNTRVSSGIYTGQPEPAAVKHSLRDRSVNLDRVLVLSTRCSCCPVVLFQEEEEEDRRAIDSTEFHAR
jgi:hypothetical protein